MSSNQRGRIYSTLAVSLEIAAISASSALSVYLSNEKYRRLKSRIRENCASERQGRVRAQQALREAVARPLVKDLHGNSYPIGVMFDLKDVKPNDLVEYGLGCLEKLATLGDECAKETRAKMKVMNSENAVLRRNLCPSVISWFDGKVAGGDGNVGWVQDGLGELNKQELLSVPPVGIIPLGTGK